MRLYEIPARDVEGVAERPLAIAVEEKGNFRLTGRNRDGRAIIVVIASDQPDFVITTFPDD